MKSGTKGLLQSVKYNKLILLNFSMKEIKVIRLISCIFRFHPCFVKKRNLYLNYDWWIQMHPESTKMNNQKKKRSGFVSPENILKQFTFIPVFIQWLLLFSDELDGPVKSCAVICLNVIYKMLKISVCWTFGNHFWNHIINKWWLMKNAEFECNNGLCLFPIKAWFLFFLQTIPFYGSMQLLNKQTVYWVWYLIKLEQFDQLSMQWN